MKNILKSIVVYILQKEAQAVLKKYKPQIVAITGSVGKTSTKDAIYTALSNFYVSRKSQKSFNGELGIPLTILGKPNAEQSLSGWIKNILEGLDLILLPTNYPEWLVLEVGTDRPGDIEAVTEWIKPDITVVTRLSKVPVHVEFFPTLEDLFNEKGNLVRATKPGGSVILNVDDEDVLAYKKLTDEKIILFGNSLNADIRAIDYRVSYDQYNLPKGICFNVEINDKKYLIELLGTLGEHHAYHILAALATVRSLNEKLDIASKSFNRHEPTAGRMRLVRGIKDSMIIDDTYNSSPVALTEALTTLKNVKAKRKIAVLGDMLELGKYSIEAHKMAGKEAADAADILVTVGLRAQAIADSAMNFEMNEKQIFQFEESREAGVFLQNIIEKGDLILIKGSQGIRMEKTVEEVMQEPERKLDLLVRQDGMWQKK